jgi:alpha-beta hydrolase superfamily lysophospholipase
MDTVVLVHGLGRTRRSMRPLARALTRAGYRVVNIGHPSWRRRLPDLARGVAEKIETALAAPATDGEPAATPSPSGGGRVHFVGHSLGGIIIRWIVAHRRPPGLGRIVLLTPPNQGAKAADLVLPWLGWLVRCLPDLTVSGGVARSIPTPAGVEFGVIVGTRDYTVKPHETHLPGETDRAEVPYHHMFVMAHRDVQERVVRFLGTGRFEAD